MKEKLTIAQKLSKRKYHQTNKFFYFLYYTVMYKFVAKKYNCEIKIVDDINKEKGPCFIIFNHLSRLDHIFVLAATYPKRFNMLCAYNEFFRSHLSFAFKHNNVLPKKQFTNDVISIKAMTSIFKQGGSVAFAPEGIASLYGESHPIIAGTGHLLKHFDVPVYFAELRGQHLTSPWYNPEVKKGKSSCTLRLLYTKEDLKSKDESTIDEELNKVLYHDEFEMQLKERTKFEMHNHSAENLEDFCFECPSCHEKFKMVGKGDTIKCNSCGAEANINEYYDIIPKTKNYFSKTITSWVREERKHIIKDIRNDENYSYTFNTEIGMLPKYVLLKDKKTTNKVGNGVVTIDHSGFHYTGTINGIESKIDVDYKSLYTLILTVDTTYFGFYIKGEYHEFYPENKDIVGYLLLLVEEMHRLHVNTYKNYSWHNDMYE